MSWICAELEFGSLFSYRIPNFSPSFALSSPVPGPSAVRMSLVSTAIEVTGSVDFGKELFDLVKKARLEIEPPQGVAISKVLIRRLKKKKGKDALERTFGIREYVLFDGPLRLFLNIENQSQRIKQILLNLRRIGTTDSLVFCRKLSEEEPDFGNCLRKLEDNPLQLGNFSRRLVLPLNEINKEVTFDQVNIYARRSTREKPFIQGLYVFPLIMIKKGENWVIYEKVPFEK